MNKWELERPLIACGKARYDPSSLFYLSGDTTFRTVPVVVRAGVLSLPRPSWGVAEINSLLPLPPSLRPCHFSIFQREIRIDKPNSLMKNASSSDLSETVARRWLLAQRYILNNNRLSLPFSLFELTGVRAKTTSFKFTLCGPSASRASANAVQNRTEGFSATRVQRTRIW